MPLLQSWFEEKQSAWLYRVIAEREPSPPKKRMFTELADAAETQAAIWERAIIERGQAVPDFKPTSRTRIVAFLIRRLGIRPLRPVLAATKVRGMSVYRTGAAKGHPMPTSLEEVGTRHKGYGGGTLRAAVFGINDGLVSNTSLIMGVAAAGNELPFILTSGLAGLLAGALSMAAGEYISMRSQQEMFQYQIDLERQEYQTYPQEEAAELALIYGARGMDPEEARRVSQQVMSDEEVAMDVLTREELGLNPEDLGSPWGAAVFSFLFFTVGAVVPLVPFLAGFSGGTGIGVAAMLSAASLFVVGVSLSLFTGRNALRGGLRMLFIGTGAGAITYVLGYFLGVELG